MITIEKPVMVDEERMISIHLPKSVEPGLHHLVVMMDEKAENSDQTKPKDLDFPIFRNAEIIAGTFRRKEIYDNGGR